MSVHCLHCGRPITTWKSRLRHFAQTGHCLASGPLFVAASQMKEGPCKPEFLERVRHLEVYSDDESSDDIEGWSTPPQRQDHENDGLIGVLLAFRQTGLKHQTSLKSLERALKSSYMSGLKRIMETYGSIEGFMMQNSDFFEAAPSGKWCLKQPVDDVLQTLVMLPSVPHTLSSSRDAPYSKAVAEQLAMEHSGTDNHSEHANSGASAAAGTVSSQPSPEPYDISDFGYSSESDEGYSGTTLNGSRSNNEGPLQLFCDPLSALCRGKAPSASCAPVQKEQLHMQLEQGCPPPLSPRVNGSQNPMIGMGKLGTKCSMPLRPNAGQPLRLHGEYQQQALRVPEPGSAVSAVPNTGKNGDSHVVQAGSAPIALHQMVNAIPTTDQKPVVALNFQMRSTDFSRAVPDVGAAHECEVQQLTEVLWVSEAEGQQQQQGVNRLRESVQRLKKRGWQRPIRRVQTCSDGPTGLKSASQTPAAPATILAGK